MNLVELKTFLTVIEEKGISAAALKLNITQPAVTKRLDNLKHSFKINKLFSRNAGEFIMSKEASVLKPYAQNVIALSENAQSELTKYTSGNKGNLKIGCGTAWSMTQLPEVIAKSYKKFPEIEINVNIDDPDILLDKLSKNEIDILFSKKPNNDTHFDFYPIRKDKYLIYVSKFHPLAKKKVILKNLINYKWVVSSAAVQTLGVFNNIFTSQNLKKPIIYLNTNSPRISFKVVEQSDLILFTSAPASSSPETSNLLELKLKETENMTRISGIVTCKAYKSQFLTNLLNDLGTL
jgi:DNA-binding transcriptional LysR family regulator